MPLDLSRLVDLCNRYLDQRTGDPGTLPALSVLRRAAVSDIEASVYEPVVCLILQGSKTTAIGDQVVDLAAGDALVVSHHLPVVSRITRASVPKPYLALILSLDLALVRSLHDQVAEAPGPATCMRSLAVGRAENVWLAPLVRYLELMDSAQDARVLGPSVLREVHYRLLLSPIGRMLRSLLVADSRASRIAKAIQMLRTDLRSSPGVAELARTAGMSASSLHQHFKAVTGTTPLQYLKDLRLIEARAMLAGGGRSVSEVAYAVGYESPTHFSRDYSRKHGLPPSRDAGGNPAAPRRPTPASARPASPS